MGLSPIFTPQQKNETGSSPGCDRPSQGSAHKLLFLLGTTEKGRILQTIYVPLPVVDVHSNFASGKTARFISSPKRNMTAFRSRSLSELPITARLAQPPVAPPRRCRTTTMWNESASFPEAPATEPPPMPTIKYDYSLCEFRATPR